MSVNVNQNVIVKDLPFWAEKSSVWWDVNGPSHCLHEMNPIRIKFVIEGLVARDVIKMENSGSPNALEGLKILDVGCGAGIFAEGLGKLKGSVVGIDTSQELIDVARGHVSMNQNLCDNVTYICDTIENYSMSNANKYEVIVCSEVLEHVEDKKSFLEACCKVLKPGGSIFVTTWSKTFVSWFFGLLWAQWILAIVPRGTHRYRLFISPDKVANILKKHQVETKRTKGIFYNIFTKKYDYQSFKSLGYALHAVKES